MYYEIDENNAVKIYDGVNPEPFWFQPHYPNEEAFDTREEAQAWAELALASQTSETAPFPPNEKGGNPIPKPTKEEITLARLESMGLDIETLRNLLN